LPTYEYTCTECGHPLEAVQKFSDPALTECPDCGGRLRKVYGAVGIVLKGSGFYKTDSRAASNGNGNGKPKTEVSSSSSGEGGSKSDSSPSDTPKSDTKTETAKPAKETSAAGAS
jgi:putative FmdB family regulatory protein